MSLIQSLQEEINRLEEKFPEISDIAKNFKTISGVEKYIGDDSENYGDPSSYETLLSAIAELGRQEFRIENIASSSKGGKWVLSFDLNGKIEKIKLRSDTDWIQMEFLDALNKILAKHKSEVFPRFVFILGQQYADQFFGICLLSDEKYLKLKNVEPVYAG